MRNGGRSIIKINFNFMFYFVTHDKTDTSITKSVNQAIMFYQIEPLAFNSVRIEKFFLRVTLF